MYLFTWSNVWDESSAFVNGDRSDHSLTSLIWHPLLNRVQYDILSAPTFHLFCCGAADMKIVRLICKVMMEYALRMGP